MFRNLFRKICQFPDSFMQRNNDEDITTGNVPLRQRPNIFLFQKFYLLYNTDEQVAGFEENCLVFSLVLSLALALAFSLDSLAVFSSFFELSSMADFIISPSDEEASVSAAAVGDDDEKIFEIAADRREMGKGSIRREDRHLLV
nr:hypothetical protein Iba_chr08dCG12370 [Ipomoea batatas]